MSEEDPRSENKLSEENPSENSQAQGFLDQLSKRMAEANVDDILRDTQNSSGYTPGSSIADQTDVSETKKKKFAHLTDDDAIHYEFASVKLKELSSQVGGSPLEGMPIYSYGKVTITEDMATESVLALNDVSVLKDQFKVLINYGGLDNEPILFDKFLIFRRVHDSGGQSLKIISNDGRVYQMKSNSPFENMISRTPLFAFKVNKAVYLYIEKRANYVSVNNVHIECSKFHYLSLKSEVKMGEGMLRMKIHNDGSQSL